MKELEQYISNSKKNIEILEESVKKNQFNIQLNTLIPNYTDFNKSLINNGYDKFEIFTGGGNMPLDKKLLSIGLDVDPIFLYKILKILLPDGIELISLIDDDDSKEYRKNDIVIGSHAYKFGRKTCKIDSDLLEKISKVKSKNALHKLLS